MNFTGLISLVEKIKENKVSVKDTLSDLSEYNELIDTTITEIDTCVSEFNQGEYDSKLFINASHTASILNSKLSNASIVFEILLNNNRLQEQVLDELISSKYFNSVWEIDDPKHLLINIVILLYRTSCLFLFEELKIGKAQISSTIEEMSLDIFLKGKSTDIYNATKHWMLDWKSEGFSSDIITMIK